MPPLFHCFRVLKPPGGGSSDIFGAAPEETSPRRVKNHNQSQLGSALFGDTPNNSNSNETPRNKPGNDSYNRLFGPPDAPPTTPNAKNHMRSNISLSGESMSSSVSSGAATSPAKSTGSSDSIAGVLNGYAASNGNNMTNDVTGKGVNSPSFQRIQQPPIPSLPHLCITKKGYTVYTTGQVNWCTVRARGNAATSHTTRVFANYTLAISFFDLRSVKLIVCPKRIERSNVEAYFNFSYST